MAASQAPHRFSRFRWLAGLCAVTVTVALLPPVRMSYAAAASAAEIPAVQPGPGPVDRPPPASARPNTAFPPDKRPPVVPPGTKAGGKPRALTSEQWSRVPKPGAKHRASAVDAFTNVLLLPGYVLGDTSLVAYFDVQDESWSSWIGDLNDRARVGDGLTPNHIPQAALNFVPYRDHAAVVMTHAEHLLTRTYGPAGRVTARLDAGLSFREVLAKDLWDLRRIGQQVHGDSGYFNTQIMEIIQYYRSNYPHLL